MFLEHDGWKTAANNAEPARCSPWDHPCIALSSDGTKIAIGAPRGRDRIAVMDAKTGELLALLLGQATHLVWSADAATLIAVHKSEYQEVTLWDYRAKKVIRRLDGTTGPLAMSPSGKTLAVQSRSLRSLELYDLTTGEKTKTFVTSNAAELWSLTWSHDSQKLCGGDVVGRVFLGDLQATSIESGRLVGHVLAGTWSVAFSPDDHTVAASYDSGNVANWDLTESVLTPNILLNGHAGESNVVAWDRNSLRLASTHGYVVADNVRVWRLTVPTLPRNIQLGTTNCTSLAWSPDEKALAVTATNLDSFTLVLNPETGKRIDAISAPEGGDFPTACAWSRDGSIFSTGWRNGTVRLWDVRVGKLLRDLKLPEPWSIRALCWSMDGKTLACGCDGGPLILLNALSGEVIKKLSAEAGSVSLSPDGTRLLGGGVFSCKLWDVDVGEELRDIPGDGDPVAWIGNDRLVTARGKLNPPRHTLRILGGRRFQVTKEFDGIPPGVFSSDGRLLAST